MNEIVRYHNDLTELPLKKFTANELDLFMVMCNKLKNRGTKEIMLSFSDIRHLAHYDAKDSHRLAEDIRSTNKRLLELNIMLRDVDNPGRTVQFALFKRFVTDENKQILNIAVNEEFQWILNELVGVENGYTSFELQQFVGLKSSYAKSCYRQLKRYKSTGWWEVSIEDFKKILDIPKSYRMTDINRRVLDPIDEELSTLFTYFKIKKLHAKKTGRGRPRVEKLRFEFTLDDRQNLNETFDIDNSPKQTCPVCGQPLIEKELNGSLCWCHNNGWKEDSQCSLIFNSVAEIKNYRQLPGCGSSEPAEPSPEEPVVPVKEQHSFTETTSLEPFIKVFKDGELMQTVLINKAVFTVGRTDENDLKLDDNYVSKKHLAIYRMNDDIGFKNLSITNGTTAYLNEKKANITDCNKIYRWVNSQQLEIGKIIIELCWVK